NSDRTRIPYKKASAFEPGLFRTCFFRGTLPTRILKIRQAAQDGKQAVRIVQKCQRQGEATVLRRPDEQQNSVIRNDPGHKRIGIGEGFLDCALDSQFYLVIALKKGTGKDRSLSSTIC
ncbi:MAG: hypothetical protein IKS35_05835, partial [Clostridia bacterium]|nr:hypothetical protein [Clostridia bacterium]